MKEKIRKNNRIINNLMSKDFPKSLLYLFKKIVLDKER